MSLGIVFKGPEGIVLAADSRATLMHLVQLPQAVTLPTTPPTTVNAALVPAAYDSSTKLLKVNGQQYVAAVTWGAGAIGQVSPRTAHSFLPEFEAQLAAQNAARLSVQDFATALSAFFLAQWTAGGMSATPPQNEQMFFLVGGFDANAPYGRVFEFHIPLVPQPVEKHINDFGFSWGGQREFVDRLISGFDPNLVELMKQEFNPTQQDLDDLQNQVLAKLATPIPYQFLPLQDCVDLSIFFIRTTINLQKWQLGVRGVGGPIDVATITRIEGFDYVQQKKIRGEI